MQIAKKYASIMADVVRVARDAGRAPDDICVLAVSKKIPAAAIAQVLAAGHRDFGENRMQEAVDKWHALKRDYPQTRLHFIGALQSNKVAQACALFDAVHSLDRAKLARAFAAERARMGKCPELFIQVNLGGEAQKSGVAPDGLPALVGLVRDELRLPLRGLMCLPPRGDVAAPHFAWLARQAQALDLPFLSMGMSADYAHAIQQGATHIRLGTAIFGARGE